MPITRLGVSFCRYSYPQDIKIEETNTSSTYATVLDNFRTQAQHCRNIGSLFYAELLPELGELIRRESDIGEVFAGWQGEPNHDAVALRFVAALNYLVVTKQDAELVAVFPPEKQLIGSSRRDVLKRAISTHKHLILKYLKSPPQTNEVGRSMALLGGFLEVANRFGTDMDIFEIGASAGLNMMFDQYHYQADEWHWGDTNSNVQFELNWLGMPPPLTSICVHNRTACDISPVDVHTEKNKLLSYVWPDQVVRVERIRGAINHAKSAQLRIDAIEASAWIQQQGNQGPKTRSRVFYHSIIWQYFSQHQKQRFEQAMQNIGEQATNESPLIWLRLEPSQEAVHAELRMDVWPKHSQFLLAQSGYHGEWVKWLGA